MPAELVLALGRPGGHAAADGEHGFGVPPAQLPLPAHQARHVVAHHPRRAHGPHVPAGGKGQGSAGGPRPPPGTGSGVSSVLGAPSVGRSRLLEDPELQLPLLWWKAFEMSSDAAVFNNMEHRGEPQTPLLQLRAVLKEKKKKPHLDKN